MLMFDAIHDNDVEQVTRIISDAVAAGTIDDLMSGMDSFGRTPLHRAKAALVPTLAALLEASPAFTADSPHARFALREAARLGLAHIVQQLVERDVIVNSLDAKRASALHNAAQGGHLATVQVLVDAGADLNSADRNKCTPLLLAARHKHISTMKYLLDAGADLQACDRKGQTALMLLVAARADVSVLREMLHRGIDFTARDCRNRTALEVARRVRHRAAAKLLQHAHEMNGLRMCLVAMRSQQGTALSRLAKHELFDVNVLGSISLFLTHRTSIPFLT